MSSLITYGLFAAALFFICRDTPLAEAILILGGILAAIRHVDRKEPEETLANLE